MLALTVKQPWASALCAGVKPVENRSWAPKALRNGEALWVAVHAGTLDRALDQAVAPRPVEEGPVGDVGGSGWQRPVTGWDRLREEAWPAMPERGRLPTRAVIGAVCFQGLARVEDLPPDPWTVGPLCWQVADFLRLAQPVPMSGALGLWPLPEEVAEKLREAFRTRENHRGMR